MMPVATKSCLIGSFRWATSVRKPTTPVRATPIIAPQRTGLLPACRRTVLEEQDYFKSFAIDRRQTNNQQSPEDRPFVARTFHDGPFALLVKANPARPYTLWKNQFMMTASTTMANIPVAACRWSTGALMLSMSATTMNQVAMDAAKDSAAPTAIGFQKSCRRRTMLAVRAASTRTASRPSRNTTIPVFMTAAAGLIPSASGSGLPCETTPCHTRTARIASTARPMSAVRMTDHRM